MTDKNVKGHIIAEFLTSELHILKRSTLLKRMWAFYRDAREIDEIMATFTECGILKAEPLGRDTMYTMPQSQVEDFKRLFKPKQ